MADEILALIASYLKAVRRAVAALETHLQTTDPLGTAHRDRRRREGSIDSTTTYSFHGVGCCVTFGETIVDFDFGPGGIVGGLDAWRLSLSRREIRSGYPDGEVSTMWRRRSGAFRCKG